VCALGHSQAGDPAVGKTALVQMFHSSGQRFPKHYLMTLGVEFCTKAVPLLELDTTVELHLFDTAGQVCGLTGGSIGPYRTHSSVGRI